MLSRRNWPRKKETKACEQPDQHAPTHCIPLLRIDAAEGIGSILAYVQSTACSDDSRRQDDTDVS